MGINTADKKPQVVKDPETHKTRVRMVPVDRDVIKTRENKRFKEMRKEEKDPNEYDNEGSMMKSQLKQICSANEKLMSMVKDDDNLPEWVQSKVTKATDYIRSVRDYLEAENMEEKTLTPAELKKRNDVAKAIKKDDPDMPMDKKMAIATSVAKKTAEDVKEVSSNTLGNYMRKSSAAAAKPGASVRTQDKRIGGQKMADNKIRKKMGYSSPAKVPAGKNEGKARDRLLKIMNKASGRTMADRENDAAAATARRKEADKDLQSFRQKMGK